MATRKAGVGGSPLLSIRKVGQSNPVTRQVRLPARLSGPWPPLRCDAVLVGFVTAVVAVWAIATEWPSIPRDPALTTACIALSASLAAAGTILVRGHARPLAGVWLLISSVLSPLNSAMGWDQGPTPFVRSITEGIFYLALVGALLVYQRPLDLLAKIYLGYLGMCFVAGQMVLNLLSRPEWQGYPSTTWWVPGRPDRGLYADASRVMNVAAVVAAVWFAALIVARQRRSRSLDRHTYSPVVITSSAAFIVAAGAWVTAGHITVLELGVLGAIPLSFLAGGLRIRLLQARLSHDLTALSTSPTISAVEDALQAATRDPSLTVSYWVPDHHHYVDRHGSLIDLSDCPPTRVRVGLTSSTDNPLAVIDADRSLGRYRSYLDDAVQACGLALETAHLNRLVQSQIETIRYAQSRAAASGLDERRRLERDLHDGAQQHLLALATTIGLATAQTSEPGVRHTLSEATVVLHEALQELRELARGIHPAILTTEGLAAAIQVAAERLPIAVHTNIGIDRLPDVIEHTCYYLICEALTNAAKHSQALQATVSAHTTPTRVTIAVSDDGIGGVDPSGAGVQGMLARARALGGDASIDSPRGAGTLVTAWLPVVPVLRIARGEC